MGRLDKEKNLDLVLRALGRLPRRIPIHFAIAGTGAQHDQLERLVDRLHLRDRVTMLGFVPNADLPALYRAAHCFVMAGTAELQSIATMEAMASGLPVLAADAMALPELVHDAENGYLFDRDDPEGLCVRMQALFTDEELRRRMAEASLALIQKHALVRPWRSSRLSTRMRGCSAGRSRQNRDRPGLRRWDRLRQTRLWHSPRQNWCRPGRHRRGSAATRPSNCYLKSTTSSRTG